MPTWAHNLLLIAAKAAATLVVILIAGNTFWDKYVYKDYWVYDNPDCNIAVIPLDGGIAAVPDDTYFTVAADRVLADLRWAEMNPAIVGTLIRVDSPGGTLVSSSLLADAFARAQKPIAAVIRDIGTSGGYLAATGADTIIASPMSVVGSLGVTMSYVETTGTLKKDGNRFVELVSAPFKEMMNPERPLTEEEKKILEADLAENHTDMIAQIARNRKLSPEAVAQIADGRAFTGTRAQQLKLIDTLGDQETARAWFEEETDMSVDFCEPPPPAPVSTQ